MRRLTAALASTAIAAALAGCKQPDGGACQVDDDCESGQCVIVGPSDVLHPRAVCKPKGGPFDAAPITPDAAVDGGPPDATVDAMPDGMPDAP